VAVVKLQVAYVAQSIPVLTLLLAPVVLHVL
jgi:hypothetical protein